MRGSATNDSTQSDYGVYVPFGGNALGHQGHFKGAGGVIQGDLVVIDTLSAQSIQSACLQALHNKAVPPADQERIAALGGGEISFNHLYLTLNVVSLFILGISILDGRLSH